MLKAENFEVAAVMFESAQEQYRAALDAFEEAASKDHTLWLGWALQKAEGDLPSDQKAVTWMVLAEAS